MPPKHDRFGAYGRIAANSQRCCLIRRCVPDARARRPFVRPARAAVGRYAPRRKRLRWVCITDRAAAKDCPRRRSGGRSRACMRSRSSRNRSARRPCRFPRAREHAIGVAWTTCGGAGVRSRGLAAMATDRSARRPARPCSVLPPPTAHRTGDDRRDRNTGAALSLRHGHSCRSRARRVRFRRRRNAARCRFGESLQSNDFWCRTSRSLPSPLKPCPWLKSCQRKRGQLRCTTDAVLCFLRNQMVDRRCMTLCDRSQA